MRDRRKRPEGIKSIVTKVIGTIETKGPGKKEKVLNAWEACVGQKASSHSRPVGIRRKIITIEIDSSAWLYELSLKKKRILKDIKKELGEKNIEDIRFRMGDIT